MASVRMRAAIPAAHHGAARWWLERLSAVALLPTPLLLFSLLLLPDMTYTTLLQWLQEPWVSAFFLLLLLLLPWHMNMGLQMVIEDYIPHPGRRLLLTLVLQLGLGLLTVLGLLAWLQVLFGDL